jgi:hypothetical protein
MLRTIVFHDLGSNIDICIQRAFLETRVVLVFEILEAIDYHGYKDTKRVLVSNRSASARGGDVSAGWGIGRNGILPKL